MNALSLPGLLPPPPPPVPVVVPAARRVVGRWTPIPAARTTVTAVVHKRDLRFKVNAERKRPPRRPAKRGKIRGFSEGARARLMSMARNTSDMWRGFVTLTYPADWPSNGPTCKEQINRFCSWLRRNETAYLWVLEFQERGAPHFHMLVDKWVQRDVWAVGDTLFKIAGEKDSDGKWIVSPEQAREWISSGKAHRVVRGLDSAWYEAVGSGDIKHLFQGTRVDGVKNPDEVGIYISKYVGKLSDKNGFETKKVPASFENVGRFWGASRNLDKVLLYQMDGTYAEAVDALGPFVEGYQAERIRWSERIQEKAEKTREWHKRADLEARAMSYAEPWTWRGYGFRFIGGAKSFRDLERAAIQLDGATRWRAWDGKAKRPPPRFVSTKDRLDSMGQMTIDGGLEPLYPRYDE